MFNRRARLLRVLVGICFVLQLSLALSPIKHATKMNKSTTRTRTNTERKADGNMFYDRRALLQIVSAGVILLSPQSAVALQARNEALCGTGFFTNIALYKCTEIGDISQDGKAQSLTDTEESSMQSLLDKMGVDAAMMNDLATPTKDNTSKEKVRSVSNPQATLSTS